VKGGSAVDAVRLLRKLLSVNFCDDPLRGRRERFCFSICKTFFDPLVYECKQLCSSLCQNGMEVWLMWIPSHVGLVGNELVDERARQVALEGSIFDRSLSSNDFQSVARPALMRAWQAKWDSADNGRFAHSIFPDVTLRP
jgi:hypothetical protein